MGLKNRQGRALYPQTGDEKIGPLKATPVKGIFVPQIKPGQFTPDRDETAGKRYFKTKYNPNQPFNLDRPTVDRSGQVADTSQPYQSTKLVGDVDPFTGQAQGGGKFPDNDEQGILVKGITEQLSGIAELLGQNLAAVRALNPNVVMTIDGPASLQATQMQQYFFEIDGRRCPALRLLIQNNSASLVNIGLSNSASTGDLQIAANGGVL